MSGPRELAEEPEGEARPAIGRDPVTMVTDLLVGMERAEIDLPHIVLSRSAHTDEINFSGPYSCGLTALQAAEAEHLMELKSGGDGELTFHVAPLYPPVMEPVVQGGAGPGPHDVAPAGGLEWRRSRVLGFLRMRAARWLPHLGSAS